MKLVVVDLDPLMRQEFHATFKVKRTGVYQTHGVVHVFTVGDIVWDLLSDGWGSSDLPLLVFLLANSKVYSVLTRRVHLVDIFTLQVSLKPEMKRWMSEF